MKELLRVSERGGGEGEERTAGGRRRKFPVASGGEGEGEGECDVKTIRRDIYRCGVQINESIISTFLNSCIPRARA